MESLKMFVVDGSVGYARWFAEKVFIVDAIKNADIVLFTGGEDIWPGLYKHRAHPSTYHGPVREEFGMPRRDYVEVNAFKEALRLAKPMFGVCRGIQFLTAMNGGTLIQHVNNHAGADHNIVWWDGEITDTTSLHHQMCNPYNLPKDEYQILAVAERVDRSKLMKHRWGEDPFVKGNQLRSPVHLTADGDIEIPDEPEVIYYPKTRSMGIQGHPEMYRNYDTPLHVKLRGLIQSLLLIKKPVAVNE